MYNYKHECCYKLVNYLNLKDIQILWKDDLRNTGIQGVLYQTLVHLQWSISFVFIDLCPNLMFHWVTQMSTHIRVILQADEDQMYSLPANSKSKNMSV